MVIYKVSLNNMQNFQIISGRQPQDKQSQQVNVVSDQLKDYFVSDRDEAVSSPNYYGFIKKDGSWYIMRQTSSSGVYTYRYVKGSSDYATNWTNRASLSYDYFYNIF